MAYLTMAGAAEVAVGFPVMFFEVGLITLTAIVLMVLGFRSRLLSVLALALVVLLGVFFVPWEAYQTVTSRDSEYISLMNKYRSSASYWVLASVISLVSVVWAFLSRKNPIDSR